MNRFVLLGDPVAHSRSPAIHRAALSALGLEGDYVAHRCDAVGVPVQIDLIRSGELTGANVTMPLKAVAAECADGATAVVSRIGAANLLGRVGGVVVADNTDVGGIGDAWERGGLPEGSPVLVLGSGGAAAAALVALEEHELFVSARRPDAAAAMVERVGVRARFVAWGTAVPGAVVVNATPIGMRGDTLPDGLLAAASGLFDMAYGATATPAVAAMGDVPVVDGIDLLVAQAVRSLEIWTGLAAPFEAMEAAARR